MTVRVPDYVLIEAVQITLDMTLEAGTFVKPILPRYLPKHCLEDKRWSYIDKDKSTWCYTYYGIIPIPTDKIREA